MGLTASLFEQRMAWVSVSAVLFLLLLGIVALFLLMNKRKRKTISELLEQAKYVKSTQDELSNQNMRLNLLVGGMEVALWDCEISPEAESVEDMLSPDAAIWFSEGIREMFGYTGENDFPNVMRSWFDNIHPDDAEAVYTQTVAHLRDITNKTPFVFEIRMRMKNGQYKWVHIFGNTLRDANGKPLRTSGATEDISKRKDAEREIAEKSAELEIALHKAEAANKAKNSFLAKVSHEIRTPMSAIIGMAELALRESEKDADRERIIMIKQAGTHLLTIINDILDFYKIEEGKMEIVPGDYSVASLIEDVVGIIRTKMADSRLRFALMVDSKMPRSLFGDETRIRQIVLNILNNAVKYTREGFVSLGVYGEFIGGNMNLIFEVADSGIGIKPEDTDRLFSEFERFDQERNIGIEGVGLGLAITKSIVKAMGGGISVQSKYGEGSKFTVTVPQKYHSREPLAKVPNPDEKSLLIFERRAVYADSIAYSANNLGVRCSIVANGADLYEKMKSRTCDYLIISHELLKEHEEKIAGLGKDMRTVILAEFDEAIPKEYPNVMTMPAYCTHIANLLNGSEGRLTNAAHGKSDVSFSATGTKVLVADDINTNLKVARGLLAPYKMQVDLVKSGMAAIEAVQSERYDLIFMDHRMPGMDGVETTQRIREMGEKDPYYKRIPIIGLTANAVTGVMEMLMENGFDDFLSKPIDTAKLDAILAKWIPKEKQEALL